MRHVERAVQHLVADVTRVGAALLRDGVHEADTAARLRRLLGARAGERIGGGRAVEGHDDAVAEPEVGGGHDHERAGHEGGELHAAHPVEAAAGVAGLVGSDDEHVVRAHRGGERGATAPETRRVVTTRPGWAFATRAAAAERRAPRSCALCSA